MENVHVVDFLPKDLGFDMNMHILRFKPGASHGYIETHIQEHGRYFYSGKGMYYLDDEWVPLKKGDYVFMDSYCPQASYGHKNNEAIAKIIAKNRKRYKVLYLMCE